MRCTSCSAAVLPVVAIDIDGTLADYHNYFHAFAARYLGTSDGWWNGAGIPEYDGSVPHREWFCSAAGVDVRTFRDIKLAYRQGAQKRSQPIFVGAAEIVNALHTQAEIWLTTTRPFNRLDNIDPDTRAWLDRNGIVFDYMLADDDKYQQLRARVERERVVAVLDDLPEQYEMARAMFGPDVPMLIERPHNRCFHPTNTANSLEVAAVAIELRIRDWRRQYGQT